MHPLVNWKEIESHMNWKRRMRSIIYPANKLKNRQTTIAAFAKIKKHQGTQEIVVIAMLQTRTTTFLK